MRKTRLRNDKGQFKKASKVSEYGFVNLSNYTSPVIKEVNESLVESYFENALRYIEQFPTPEYEIFFVRSTVNARPDLIETTTFNEFKVKHQDLEV